MVSRAPVSQIHNNTQMGSARATVRKIDDNHLMQEVDQADVFHSETPSNFERWQMVGMTAVPLDQTKEQQQQQQQSKQNGEEGKGGDWNQNQPKGPAAEALMVYVGGSRSHPVALVDDRRVRPYGMKAGRGATYAPDGSEQMLYFKQDGTYLVSLDGKSVEDPKGNQTRKLVTGHVTKKMQTHKIEKKQEGQQQQSQQQEEYKHEGDKINTGIRYTKDRIEFIADDQVVAFYDKTKKAWQFDGATMTQNFTEKVTHSTPVMDDKVTQRHNLEDGALHNAYGNAGTGKTSEKVFVKAILPGPPTSLDTQA